MRKEIELVRDIEKELLLLLKTYKEIYTKEKFNFNISEGLTPIEIRFKYIEETQKNEMKTIRGIMLEVHIYSESKQIHISNILIPYFMKDDGNGKNYIYIF